MLALVHIGMAKAGSTWLFTWLKKHPELETPWPTRAIAPGKNPYFWNWTHPFSKPPRLRGMECTVRSIEHYRELADSVPKAFDVTDTLSFAYPDQIARFRAEYPDVPVTMTVRDPVEALWSHMRMHLWRPGDLHRNLALLENVKVERNLARWRDAGVQVHVFEYAELCADPLGILLRIADLVDVDPKWWIDRADEVRQRINKARFPAPLDPYTRKRLEEAIDSYV